MRDGAWKIVEDQSQGQKRDQTALYDLATDPGEKSDLRAKETARFEALRDLVLHRIARSIQWAGCYPLVEPYIPTAGDMQRLEDLGYAGGDVPGNGEEPK